MGVDALIAVVVPVYKQPQYLPDAVLSAIRQSMRRQTRIIIVNDGCPFQSTDQTARWLADVFPGEVYYLKKPNGGLSSARNYGTRFALQVWPSIRAVFPLDADNKLSPLTLERLWVHLLAAGPTFGFAYQNLFHFGTDGVVRHVPAPFSAFRLLHDNYCDAGGLIRREVFDLGIWYDEAMRDGYEDWEFYLHASLRGFRGTHAGDTGFLYRQRGHSMLAEARRKHGEIHRYILRKHAYALSGGRRARLEHNELPRYALVDVNAGSVRTLTDPLDESVAARPVADFFREVGAWARQPEPKTQYVPPILVCGRRSTFDLLSRLRVLPGLLLIAARALARFDGVRVTFEAHADADVLELSDGGAPVKSADAALLVARTRTWIESRDALATAFAAGLNRATRSATSETLRLRAGQSFTGTLPVAESAPLLDEAVEALRSLPSEIRSTTNGQAAPGPRRIYVPSHADFQEQLACEGSGFPRAGPVAPANHRPLNLWFVCPWLRLGGVERCVLRLARELARSRTDPHCRPHLLLTEANRIEVGFEAASVFDTITFLPETIGEKHKVMLSVLSAADIVVNAHSSATYEVLPKLKARSDLRYISYLHVVERDSRGHPYGYPLVASRQFGDLIDHFAVISRQLRRLCLAMGVPGEKVSIVPNAPTVAPQSRQAAEDLARSKAERRYSPHRPLRVLCLGRFDRQKGFDRLPAIAGAIRDAGVPFLLDVIGKPVFAGASAVPPPSVPEIRLLPPTTDAVDLARRYTEADVLLLPSRWEGLPLVVLEAMAFGNVVVATDVGAVGEVVSNGENGVLVEPTQCEEGLATDVGRAVAGLITDSDRFTRLRQRAVEVAMSTSWARSAAALLAAAGAGAESGGDGRLSAGAKE